MYESMKPYIEHNYHEVKRNRTKGKVESFFKEVIEINNF